MRPVSDSVFHEFISVFTHTNATAGAWYGSSIGYVRRAVDDPPQLRTIRETISSAVLARNSGVASKMSSTRLDAGSFAYLTNATVCITASAHDVLVSQDKLGLFASAV